MDPRIKIENGAAVLTLPKEEMFVLILAAGSDREEHGDPQGAEEIRKLLDGWED